MLLKLIISVKVTAVKLENRSFKDEENMLDFCTFYCLVLSTEISHSMVCFCTSTIARFGAKSVHNHSISWFVSKIVDVIARLEGQPSFSSWKLLRLANSQWYIISIYVYDTICTDI